MSFKVFVFRFRVNFFFKLISGRWGNSCKKELVLLMHILYHWVLCICHKSVLRDVTNENSLLPFNFGCSPTSKWKKSVEKNTDKPCKGTRTVCPFLTKATYKSGFINNLSLRRRSLNNVTQFFLHNFFYTNFFTQFWIFTEEMKVNIEMA